MMQFMDAMYRWARPEHKPSSLHAGFENAIGELVSGKRGKARRQMQRLPWYLMLGLPRSGKSALLHSAAGNQWREIGRLREHDRKLDCDWWHSGEAVVMDIGGYYALADERNQYSSWQHLTRLLDEYLHPKAIHGVILVVSAEDLLDPDSEGMLRKARILRQCLYEMQLRCSYQIPCYLLISKCDLLAGFSDFFCALSHEERQQPWGTALNQTIGPDELPSGLTALQDIVQTMLPQRLQAERNAAVRRNIATFPMQFSRLQQDLPLLVEAIFPRSRAEQPSLLRGVYFTGAPTGTGNGQSHFFSGRLFSEVFFADPVPRQLACDSHSLNYRLRQFSLAAIVATIVLMLMWFTAAFVTQQRDITATLHLLHQNAEMLANSNDDRQTLVRSNAVVETLERALILSRQHDTGWAALPGMRDDSVSDAVQSTHQLVLEQRWLPALSSHLLRWIQTPDTSMQTQFNALKAWLMLVDPTHRDVDFLQQWIQHSSPFDAADRAIINARLQQLYDGNIHFAAPVTDRIAIAQIRNRLAVIPLADRIYDQWKQQHQGKFLSLKPLLGTHVDSVFRISDDALWNIPTLYTADTHRQLHLDGNMRELELLEHDWWVLGDKEPDTAQRSFVIQSLTQRYLTEYALAWNSLFKALSLRKPSDNVALLAVLQPLSDPAASPLSALLRISAEQFRPLAGSKQVFDPGSEKIPMLETNLARLRDWLSAIRHTEGTATDTQPAAIGDLTPPQRVLAFSEQLSPPVSSWVAALARAASDSVNERTKSAIDLAWRTQVADFCRANIGDRYPFTLRAQQTASYSDFVDYFRPGGIEDSFVRTQLGDNIDRASWTSKAGAAITLPARTLRLLQQAQKIRNAFFRTADAKFAFNVTPLRMSANLQRFTIDAGTAHFRYSHGPKMAAQLRWPQDNDSLSTRFTAFGGSNVTRNYEGIWGLYRWLDAAQRTPGNDSGQVILTLHEGEQSIALALAPVTDLHSPTDPMAGGAPRSRTMENPLRRELLSDYHCLQSLR